MSRARRWLRATGAFYLLGLIGWLAWPAPAPDLAAAWGAMGTGLAALYAALDPAARPGPRQAPARALWRAAGLGLAAGAAAPALGAALMVLRTALHARPEFAEAALLGLLARAPVWAGAGLLAGAGLALLGLAARRPGQGLG